MPGKLIIFSAPSGSGKTTIVQHLVSKYDHLGFSISACTREPRSGKERHGVDYYFLSAEDFEHRVQNGDFVEWEEVYAGVRYGTLKEEIERIWSIGKDVIFDVDVVGGLRLKEYYKDLALAVFVKAPSFEIIASRLKSRGTEDEASLEKRLNKIRKEMEYEPQFDVTLVNDKLEQALDRAESLITEFTSLSPSPH